jgi:hypothetical protein
MSRHPPTSRLHDIETAMHARGLSTAGPSASLEPRPRAGTPVVLVDNSSTGSRDVTVGRVKARWKTTTTKRRPLDQLLPRAKRDRVAAEGAT